MSLSDESDINTFQLTHPTRSATGHGKYKGNIFYHFNSRTPRGVRQRAKNKALEVLDFNSRTPRGVRRVTYVGNHNK